MNNNKLSLSLIEAMKDLNNMSDDDIFRICNGYTPEEEKKYTEELFEKDIVDLKSLIEKNNGEYDTDDNIINLPAVFWGRLSEKVSYSYQSREGFFPSYFEEFEKYGLKLESISGQGTITKFSFLDIKSEDYIMRKILREKKNKIIEIEKQKNRILKKLPKAGFFIKFCFSENNEKKYDTGVVSDVKIISVESKMIEITIDSIKHGIINLKGTKCELKKINKVEILKSVY